MTSPVTVSWKPDDSLFELPPIIEVPSAVDPQRRRSVFRAAGEPLDILRMATANRDITKVTQICSQYSCPLFIEKYATDRAFATDSMFSQEAREKYENLKTKIQPLIDITQGVYVIAPVNQLLQEIDTALQKCKPT
jgi:hypothetical protein